MKGENDYWLATVSGGEIDLLEPTPAQFDMGEIAEALANICRFSGRVATRNSLPEPPRRDHPQWL